MCRSSFVFARTMNRREGFANAPAFARLAPMRHNYGCANHESGLLRPRRHTDRSLSRHHPLHPARTARHWRTAGAERFRTCLVHWSSAPRKPRALGRSSAGRLGERFDAVGWRENAVYEGIPDTLERLHRAGLALYVATSKPRLYAERIVGHFGLAAYFRTIFGAELDGRNADKSDLLAVALATSEMRACAPKLRHAVAADNSHDVGIAAE